MFEILVPYWEVAKPYVVGVIKGFGAGVFAAGLGYLKTRKDDGSLEDFDGIQFTRTIIVGGIIGALGEGFGIRPETAEEWLAYPFVVYSLDMVTKVVYRRALKPIVDQIGSFLKK